MFILNFNTDIVTSSNGGITLASGVESSPLAGKPLALGEEITPLNLTLNGAPAPTPRADTFVSVTGKPLALSELTNFSALPFTTAPPSLTRVDSIPWEREEDFGPDACSYSDGPNGCSYLRFLVVGDEFRTLWKAADGSTHWRNDPPPPANRPLYCLEDIVMDRTKRKRVVLLADERAVKKAKEDFLYDREADDVVFVACRGYAETDFKPVEGRRLMVVGDAADYPGLKAEFVATVEDAVHTEPKPATVKKSAGRPQSSFHISTLGPEGVRDRFPRSRVKVSGRTGMFFVRGQAKGQPYDTLEIHFLPSPLPNDAKAKAYYKKMLGFETHNYWGGKGWNDAEDRALVIDMLKLGENAKPRELTEVEIREQHERNAAEQQRIAEENQKRAQAFAGIYELAATADGPALKYLRDTRKVTVGIDNEARTTFAEVKDFDEGEVVTRSDRPKLIVPRRDTATGMIVGFELECLEVNADGSVVKGKFWGGVSRYSVGEPKSYMSVKRAENAKTLAVGEGYITTCSAAQLPLAELDGADIWAMGSVENFDLIKAELPYDHFVLFVDTDEKHWGENKSVERQRKLLAAGKRVTLVRCPLPENHEFTDGTKKNWDFNDVAKRCAAEGRTALERLDFTVETLQNLAAFVSFNEFEMLPQGLYVTIERAKGEATRRWVCDAFEVLGHSHDEGYAGWGLRIRATDVTGHKHIVTVQNTELQGEPSKTAGILADVGVTISRKMQSELQDYLIRVKPKSIYTFADRTGWRYIDGQAYFVLPETTIGGAGSDKVVLNKPSKSAYAQKGTLAEWKENVAGLATGHNMLVFGISTAFTGPLLSYADIPGLGVHFLGGNSKGKTSLLAISASVWGMGAEGEGGYIRSWNNTANALEGVAALHTDTLLSLDELGEVDGKDFAKAVYSLGNGSGRGRADRSGAYREARTWRVTTMSSGEHPTDVKIQENKGQKVRGGQLVRMLDISAVKDDSVGVFDKIESEPKTDYAKLANDIQKASRSYYGVAGPTFVRELMQRGVSPENIKEKVSRFVEDNLPKSEDGTPKNTDGQVKRALARFGLIAAAGELAIEYGLVPWVEGRANVAAKEAFDRWLNQRGGTSDTSFEAEQAIEAVRSVIEQYGQSRFELFQKPIDGKFYSIHNRYGWRKDDGDKSEWLILPQVWKDVVCNGLDPKSVAKRLVEAKMLQTGANDRFTKVQKIPTENNRAHRVYVVTARILDGFGDAEDGTQTELDYNKDVNAKGSPEAKKPKIAETPAPVYDDVPF